jgi:hypothetical protein
MIQSEHWHYLQISDKFKSKALNFSHNIYLWVSNDFQNIDSSSPRGPCNGKQYVFCELETEFLNFMNFMLQVINGRIIWEKSTKSIGLEITP